eukprot:gb/GEZN01012055.1/.p1 GENE.gb/GEZN01012055.1/~~gb/GEZN01012055.1/.p1  ORF type:complete len:296 (-),score=24.76 gb/GEZN01012055.1/:133-1020(-)
MKKADWSVMSRLARNHAFNNAVHVGTMLANQKKLEWSEASVALRKKHSSHLDLPYGAAERNRWDLFPSRNPDAPCHVHIHGGWWHMGSRQDVACMVDGALKKGWSAALPGYTLAPQVTLTQILEELWVAFDWFGKHASSHGINGPVVLTGHSAGGYLAAMVLSHPAVSSGMAISGAFELGPLRDVPFINEHLNFSEEEVEKLSPMRLTPVGHPLSIAYGTKELPLMVESSLEFFQYRARAHMPGVLVPVPDANHFTILDQLQDPNSLLMRQIFDLAPRHSVRALHSHSGSKTCYL